MIFRTKKMYVTVVSCILCLLGMGGLAGAKDYLTERPQSQENTVATLPIEWPVVSQPQPVFSLPCIYQNSLVYCVKAERDMDAVSLLVDMELHRWPSGHRRDFLYAIAPAALLSARDYGVYPSVIMAQAILETGWGKSGLAKRANNLFGIKGTARSGIRTRTYEEVNGKSVPRIAYFAVFSSWSDSIDAHGRLLSKSHFYRGILRQSRGWFDFIHKISPIYASSRSYANRVAALIRRYRLDCWDELVHVFKG